MMTQRNVPGGPIWASSQSFVGYPLDLLPAPLEAALREIEGYGSLLHSHLVRLQCYCDITGTRLTNDLNSAGFSASLLGFCAANYSQRFVAQKAPWVRLRLLRDAVTLCFPTVSFPVFPATWNEEQWSADFRDAVADFNARPLDQNRVRFWRGWSVTNASGRIARLPLWKFESAFGTLRTQELHAAATEWFAKGRHQKVPVVADFANWLADNAAAGDFDSQNGLGQRFREFHSYHFRSRHAAGVALSTLLVEWRHFFGLMTQHLCGHAWAIPLPAIPAPLARPKPGTRTNLALTEAGVHVKQTLLTSIPLQLTDAAAKELLFADVARDVETLLRWARLEVQAARLRLERRMRIAPEGIVAERRGGLNPGIMFRLSTQCPDRLAHAAATFQAHGFSHLGKGRVSGLIYPEPVAATCWDLGIPTPALLLAHATVLVALHPQITCAFLASIELYDRHGAMVGVRSTDAGTRLVGYKRRRGVTHSEQAVLLLPEAVGVVEDVMALTAPLRTWLRSQSDDRWRLLFLATPSMGTRPKDWDPDQEASRQVSWLTDRLVTLVGLDTARARELATRFSLRRLRCSAAILVYFQSGSVQRMAEALGHATWKPALLDSYLPRPLQEFFVERWIRLFQTGIVCEALRDSPYLTRAAGFASMDELDEFLENHALKRIPIHLEDPEGDQLTSPSRDEARFVFGIETGVLSLLMSIEHAVRRAKSMPCGRAIRWARISERLIPHLEAQTEQPEFRSMVAEARRGVDPSLVEGLIYG